MAHVPHVFVEPPWTGNTLDVPADTQRHLVRVLRRRPGDPVTYTDGAGIGGSGVFGPGGIERGQERTEPSPPTELTVAVAPPHGSDRARMVVEKLGELGVTRLTWLDTIRGAGRPPTSRKSRAWAISALEQSRGTRLLQIDGPVPPAGPWPRGGSILVASREGLPRERARPDPGRDLVILVGPEGGFDAAEVPDSAVPVSLGPRVLRVETAAIVAAATFLLPR